jgi:hypothetical protein
MRFNQTGVNVAPFGIGVQEQKLPKVCLTPDNNITKSLYTPVAIRKALDSHNVKGIEHVYIPNRIGLAHGSIIFDNVANRNAFLKKFSEGFPLSYMATDRLRVSNWYSREEREQHRMKQELSKARGFFCSKIPIGLTAEMLQSKLPNSSGLEFCKTIENVRNGNMMASFLYKTAEDAAAFIAASKNGVFHFVADEKDGVEVELHVEVFRYRDKRFRNFVTDPDSDEHDGSPASADESSRI